MNQTGINSRQSEIEKAALEVLQTLRNAGHDAFWVGGCVRDKLLNLPIQEIDIATSASPQTVMRLLPKTIAVGAHFGVVVAMVGDIKIEVATFRSDGAYLDNRHPSEVHFSDIRQDALRRDFTINALFWDPISGRLLDFVKGREDLWKGVLRCIGKAEDRFGEDALRLLRAVRFSIRFNFPIEDETWRAMLSCSSLIKRISAERVRDELIRIFTEENRGKALEMLENSRILKEILPEVQALKGVPQPEEFHPEGDCFEHTKLSLDALRSPSAALAFGCLLHDIGKPPTFTKAERIRFDGHTKIGALMADAICRRLCFSNDEREKITDLVARHMHFLSVKDMRISTLRRFLSHPNIEEDLELHRADCLASHGGLENYEFCRDKLEEFRAEQKEIIPPPLVTGEDLIAAGYKPGPLFKEILNRIQEAQLEGEIKNRADALALSAKEFPLPEVKRQ